MSAKGNKYSYRARVKPETVPSLAELAGMLGFYVTTPGRYHGEPSIGDMLDAIGDRCRTDPATANAVANALFKVGVRGEGKPE